MARIGGLLGDKIITSFGSNTLSMNDSGEVAFTASYRNPDGTPGGGIFINDRLIVEVGSTLHGKSLTSIGVPDINNNGEIVFVASFFGGRAVMTMDELIVETGQIIDGKTIQGFTARPIINDFDEILYAASTGLNATALFTRDGLVVETGVLIEGRRPGALSEPDMNNPGDVVFFDSVARTVPFDQALMSPSAVLVVTQEVIDGVLVSRVDDPSVNNNRVVVFQGGAGLFSFDLASRTGQLLFQVPGVVDGQLIDIASNPQLNEEGDLAFIALFDNRSDRGVVASGQLVLQSGELFDGKIFSAPGGFLSQNVRGEVAFLAFFTDFSRAVVRAKIADSDGDGIDDEDDACVDSELGDTVVIGACDTNVTNDLFANGCSIGDIVSGIVDVCFVAAKNHGQAVSCVSHGTNGLKKAGILSGSDGGAIQSCLP